jgi:hypothetical protein
MVVKYAWIWGDTCCSEIHAGPSLDIRRRDEKAGGIIIGIHS